MKLKIKSALIGFLVALALTSQASNLYESDVVNIREEHLSAQYWINNAADSGQLIKNKSEITAFNQAAFAADKNLIDIKNFAKTLERRQLEKMILSVSKPAKSKRVYADGKTVSPADYKRYQKALAITDIQATTAVRYALVVNRTNMRSFPTSDRIFKSVPSDLDRFQETALFPADMVLVLHESADKNWAFVQYYNYAAWVEIKDLALGTEAAILKYKNAPDFLIISGDKVRTNYNPEVPAMSELQLDMGTKLPLTSNFETTKQHNIHGQNPYTSYAVRIPVRTAEGSLNFESALIARSRDVSIGTLAYTRATLIKQAFKFLGERYGWGHSYNGRDCSGFTAEVYKSIGIHLPRNSGQQALTPAGHSIDFDKSSNEADRLQAIAALDVGDLIFIPGHVMMFIGNSDGQPYVIHDVTGLNYFDKNGEYYSGVLNGVSITPLLPLHTSPTKRYLDMIYSIKKFK